MLQGSFILVAAALEAWLAASLGGPWAVVVGWIALVSGLVGVAAFVGWPGLLGKRPDGSLPQWSYLLFWPWHALVRGVLAIRRRVSTEPAFTEVLPGWLVGGWPHRGDLWSEWPAVIDLTCELPRRSPREGYLNLPTWDATAPSQAAIARGVTFALEQRRQGRPVLVHCAAGHGRSAAVLAAALVAAGHFPDWRTAVAHMRQHRPKVGLAPEQARALDRWTASAGGGT